jgi:predicted Zn-dependent peptidase
MLLLQATAKEGIPIEDVERVTDEEIARLISTGITEDELTRAKNRAEVDVAHQLENYDARADLIGMLSTFFGDPTLVDRWLDPYRAATTAQVVNCARSYLTIENRVTSIFVPER